MGWVVGPISLMSSYLYNDGLVQDCSLQLSHWYKDWWKFHLDLILNFGNIIATKYGSVLLFHITNAICFSVIISQQ